MTELVAYRVVSHTHLLKFEESFVNFISGDQVKHDQREKTPKELLQVDRIRHV